jgi:ATP-dependent 26S proteasome regulatory subunit
VVLPIQIDLLTRPDVVRFSLKDLEKDYEKTEDDIKAVQSVGQIIGEVMKQLDDERCEFDDSSTIYTLNLL